MRVYTRMVAYSPVMKLTDLHNLSLRVNSYLLEDSPIPLLKILFISPLLQTIKLEGALTTNK